MTRTSSEATGSGRTTAGPPALSFILATDTYETIRPVVECLRRQTVADLVEVVLVAPSATAVSRALDHGDEFAAMQIVEVDSIDSLGPARASGIRAATAPIVFIGETHSYPDPGFAEAIVTALVSPWDAVVPSVTNANPASALSWAGLLSDYGRWAAGLRGGEVHEVPGHNSAYRRVMLLEAADCLESVFGYGHELPPWMRARGRRCYFEPAARLAHANVTRPLTWARACFVFGMVVASSRGRRWSLARRLAYVLGAPLIPAVLVWRVLPGMRHAAARERLPAGTIPLVVLGSFIRAAGELVGYAGAPTGWAERAAHEYELHRLAYVADHEI